MMNEDWTTSDNMNIKLMIANLKYKQKEQKPHPMSYIESHITTLEKVLKFLGGDNE